MPITREMVACAALAFVFALSCVTQDLPGYTPKEGFVPDSVTAVKIAEAVLTPVYGERVVISERPFRAELKDGVWHVFGTLHCPVKLCVGGVAEVGIAKSDARIVIWNMGNRILSPRFVTKTIKVSC